MLFIHKLFGWDGFLLARSLTLARTWYASIRLYQYTRHTHTQRQYILSLEEMMRFTWFLRSLCDWESNVLTYLSSISPRLSILSTFHSSVSRESLFILGFSQTQYGNLIGKWILIDQSSKCWTIKWLRIWWINRFGSRVPSDYGWIEHRCFKNIRNKRADQKYHVSLSNSYKNSPPPIKS